MSATPIWQVDLRKRLQHGERRFELDIRFTSSAARLVLFGPSGAGKSQTLKLIAGLSQPDDGRVVIAGRVLHDRAQRIALSPQARRLAYVFQDYALFPHLTVRQNIAFARPTGLGGWLNPARRRAMAGGDAAGDDAVERWIEAFGLQAIVDLMPHQISGGQRQRVALARGLVREPAALLLDEPFAALDRGLRQRLRDELAQLQAELALPMLLITHDEDDVRALADAVVTVQGGRVVERLTESA